MANLRRSIKLLNIFESVSVPRLDTIWLLSLGILADAALRKTFQTSNINMSEYVKISAKSITTFLRTDGAFSRKKFTFRS